VRVLTQKEISERAKEKEEEELVFIPGVTKHISRPHIKAHREKLKSAREQKLPIGFEPGEETMVINKCVGDFALRVIEEEKKAQESDLRGVLEAKAEKLEENK